MPLIGVMSGLVQISSLEEALTANHSSLLGFCHNDLQYGNMLLHTASHRSLSMDSIGSYHSVDRVLRGSSPPPRGASPTHGRRGGIRGTSPEPEGWAPSFTLFTMILAKGGWQSRIALIVAVIIFSSLGQPCCFCSQERFLSLAFS